MIRCILFDVDQTLLDYHASEASAVSRFFAAHGREADESVIARASVLSWHYWDELNLSNTHIDSVQRNWTEGYKLAVRRFIEKLKEEYALPESASADEYMAFFAASAVPFPDVVPTLSVLAKDFVLCAASNGLTVCQTSRMARFPWFRHLFLSEALGCVKPLPAFFHQAIIKTGYQSDELLMVGDSLYSDIEGARGAGIHTLWLNRNGVKNDTSVIPEGEIQSLTELLSHPMLYGGART